MSTYQYQIPHKYKLFFAIFLFFLPLLTIPQSALAQSDIVITTEVGFDGGYRQNDWYPIHITVTNNGPSIQGTFEWQMEQYSTKFAHPVDLPTGSHKRITMYAYGYDYRRTGTLTLLADDKKLYEQPVNIQAIDSNQFVLGVLSSNKSLLNYLDRMQLTGPIVGSQDIVTVRHLNLYDLGENAASFNAVDALLFHDIDTSSLTPGQQTALLNWVQAGGQLIISGGNTAQATASGLANLLPVNIDSAIENKSTQILAQWIGANDTAPISFGSNKVSPKPNTQTANELMYRQDVVFGKVTFFAFDIASLDSWSYSSNFWQQILYLLPHFQVGSDQRQMGASHLDYSLLDRSRQFPSTFTMLLSMLLYILAIGPINYLVLKRLRKPDWAWFSIPAIVLVSVGVMYVVGTQLRGSNQINYQYSVILGQEDRAEAFVTSQIGMFSPSRSSYSASFEPNAMISNNRGLSFSGRNNMTITQDGTQFRVNDIDFNIGELKTLIVEQASSMPFSIESSFDKAKNTIAIKNNGPLNLYNITLVQGNKLTSLSDLPAGQTGSTAAIFSSDLPWGYPYLESETFDYRQLVNDSFSTGLSSLRNQEHKYNPFPLSNDPDQPIFMLAWADQVSSNITTNASNSNDIAVSLYVIQLNLENSTAFELKPTPIGDPMP